MFTILISIGMMNGMFLGANIMIYVVLDLIVGAIALIWYIWKKIENVLNKTKKSIFQKKA